MSMQAAMTNALIDKLSAHALSFRNANATSFYLMAAAHKLDQHMRKPNAFILEGAMNDLRMALSHANRNNDGRKPYIMAALSFASRIKGV